MQTTKSSLDTGLVQQVDRRTEPRQPAQGTVRLRIDNQTILTAELVDSSVHGFRVRLAQPLLVAGQEIQIIYGWGEVNARVVWVRKYNGPFEAGIYVP